MFKVWKWVWLLCATLMVSQVAGAQQSAPRTAESVSVLVSESDTAASNGAVGFYRSGTPEYFHDDFSVGDGGHMLWTRNNDAAHGIDNMGDWRPDLPQSGNYKLSVFIPRLHATTTNARYEIYHADGRTDVVVNQANKFDVWVSLGIYRWNAGTSGFLRLIDLTNESYVSKEIGFDSVKWEDVPSTYQVRGRVFRFRPDGTKIGVSNVTVKASGPTSKTATTDSQGFYRISQVSVGTYSVTAAKSGFGFAPASRTVSLPVSASVPNATEINFKSYCIFGQVKNAAGTPLAGLTLNLSGTASATTTTDSNGNYVFGKLGAGSYAVTPEPQSGFVFNSPSKNRELPTSGVEGSPNARANFVRSQDGITPSALRQ